MNREQFFGRLATLDEERLSRVLWNLYWRGSATMRERIETELDPDRKHRKRAPGPAVDPELVLAAVRDFDELARSGAYLGGDRRVSPKERGRWRFTFQRLVSDAQDALRVDESGTAGPDALATLIELACATKRYDYFRSDDPVEAARFVVSDAVTMVWSAARERHGFSGFAERAAPQLIRWESRFGWTRHGDGRVPEKETTLASVLVPMLPIPDAWLEFADRYLDALDQIAGEDVVSSRNSWRPVDWERSQRTGELAEWHDALMSRLVDYDGDDSLDRLVSHPALAGPEVAFLQARLAQRRNDMSSARDLVYKSLETLPGHAGFLELAADIGADLPARAQQIADERALLHSAVIPGYSPNERR